MEINSALAISSQYPGSFSSFRKSSQSKNRLFSSHTPDLTQSNIRSPSTPKKPKTQMLFKELERLEEELDFKLLHLNSKYQNSNYNESRQNKELKIYEQCLEGVIHCIQFFDFKVFRVLNRVWIDYHKILRKKIAPKDSLVFCNSTNTYVHTSEIAVQVEELTEELTDEMIEEDFEQYKNLMSRAIYRLGGMNHERIVKTLKKLLETLTMIEVPEYENSPKAVQEVVKIVEFVKQAPIPALEQVVKSIKNPVSKIMISKGEQTVSLYEGATVESLASLLVERDRMIYSLTEQVNKLKKTEKEGLKAEQDLIATKKALKDLQEKECKKCLERVEKIKEDKSKIEVLQKNLEKTEKVETELKVTKTKLRESVVVIGKSNEKIMHLTENLEDLTEKIEEVKAQRAQLEARLAEEEALRLALEAKLDQEAQKTSASKSRYTKHNFPTITEELLEEDSILTRKFPKQSFEHSQLLDDSENSDFDQESASKTPTLDRRKSRIFSNDNFSLQKRKLAKARSNKHKNLFKVFQITKEEFLSLSKKARLELFECLYEHKEKCGPECEHLKRAMMIRSRDKGPIFPVKKYNVVKN